MLAKLARQTALKLITENPGIADRDIAAVIYGPGSPGTMVNEVCRALHDEGVEFLIVGLAAAALQGAPAVTQDVDLWFKDLADPGIAAALRRVGGVYVAPTGSTPPMFAGRAVSLFDIVTTMHGLGPFDREAKKAKVDMKAMASRLASRKEELMAEMGMVDEEGEGEQTAPFPPKKGRSSRSVPAGRG